MNAKEIRNLPAEDFDQKLKDDKATLARMKFSHGVAGTENPMTIRAKRREIARLLTVINERKNNK